MNKLYHLTTTKNSERILKEGLKCRIGERSKLVNDDRCGIFLTDIKSLPYWQVLLDVPVVLEVKNIQHDSLERSDYLEYSEYFYSADIDKENIIPVTLEIDRTECNKELSLELLNSASSICERCARYYDELIYKLSDEQKEDHVYELYHDLILVNYMFDKIDLSVCDDSMITNYLMEMGDDGYYTICDEYKNTGLQLYEQLIHYQDDELSEQRNLVYKNCKEKLYDYIHDLKTGAWGV